MTKVDIDKIISTAGYEITLPSDAKARFQMKRLIEHAYACGVKAGMQDRETINRMIERWECDA